MSIQAEGLQRGATLDKIAYAPEPGKPDVGPLGERRWPSKGAGGGGSVSRPARSPRLPASGGSPCVRAAVPPPVVPALSPCRPAERHTPRCDATVGPGERATSRRGTTGSRAPPKAWPGGFFNCAERLVQPPRAGDGLQPTLRSGFQPRLTPSVRPPPIRHRGAMAACQMKSWEKEERL